MNNNMTHKKQPQKMKKSYNPFMFIGEAFKNLWRDRVMSTASILVLASCLVLLGCFSLLVVNININMNRLVSLNEIVVFVDYDLPPEQVEIIGQRIRVLDNVETIEFISKDSGLDSMKEDYAGFEDVFDSMKESGDNPLSDSFRIKYKDNSKVTTLDYNLRQIEGVRKVNNRLDLATSLENFGHFHRISRSTFYCQRVYHHKYHQAGGKFPYGRDQSYEIYRCIRLVHRCALYHRGYDNRNFLKRHCISCPVVCLL